MATGFNLIDTLEGDKIVGTYPTLRKAQNASRKIEPEPTIAHPERRRWAFPGNTWRYLIQKESGK